ncbi:MIP/aquaporin family protein [Sedimentitalea sp. XS_ASV28]|uniref:MIP/aquaporin family protein n=1 Tax=Sedimentitalea sp. XS_ASV28 TaxID=3241296 RepID=UPI003515D15D
MSGAFLGELLGTMTLVFLGNSVVAGAVLKDTKSSGGGWMVITTGWAVAVFMGICVAQAVGSPAAQINPAVTIAFAVLGGDWSNVVPFIAAQLIGGFLGAVLMWVYYLPHFGKTEDPGLKLAVFCTGPAIRDYRYNAVCEVMGTIVLVGGVAAIVSPGFSGQEGFSAGVVPFLVAFLVWGIGLSLGGTTGYAINPARDLPPRLAHAVLPIPGKGSSDWSYAVIPVLAPVVGGLVLAMAMIQA